MATNAFEIVIERKGKSPITKFARKAWLYEGDQADNEITEACVVDLGFSLFEESGKKKEKLRLRWQPKGCKTGRSDVFKIIPTSTYEIVLGTPACDWFQYANDPAVYPCFPKKGKFELLLFDIRSRHDDGHDRV